METYVQLEHCAVLSDHKRTILLRLDPRKHCEDNDHEVDNLLETRKRT